jgi:hypothetical protein
MEAMGIHEHPDFKLGRKPEDSTKPRLRLSQFLKALPPVPAEEDYSAITDWDMYANDQYGDCGPCDVAHSRMQVTQYLTGTMQKPLLTDVLDLYKRSGNPNFPDQDDGVNMQEMFNEVRKNGIGGVKCIAFARVDHTSEAEIDAATAIFGGVHYGALLETAQQHQTSVGLWDYSQSNVWGGHAFYGVGYTQPRRRVVTWGREVEFTDAFNYNQVEEAWVAIWPEHLQSKAFLEGVDLEALANAYKQLTGSDLPVPSPQPEPPDAGPTLDDVGDVMAQALEDKLGEPVKHLRDQHKHGKAFEKFYISESGDWEIGVMDKR